MTKKQINTMTAWAAVCSITVVLLGIGLGVYGFLTDNNIIGSIGVGLMALFSLERLRIALSDIRQQRAFWMEVNGFNQEDDKKVRNFNRKGAY